MHAFTDGLFGKTVAQAVGVLRSMQKIMLVQPRWQVVNLMRALFSVPAGGGVAPGWRQ